MAKVKRYTPKLIRAHVAQGHWTEDYAADFWDRNAAENPDGEALVAGGLRLTWAEAKARIDRLARGLVDQGFNRDDRVVVQVANRESLLLLRLASEKAGIVLVFLPETFRAAEIGRIVEITRPVAAIIQHVNAKGGFVPIYKALGRKLGCPGSIFTLEGPAPGRGRSLAHLLGAPVGHGGAAADFSSSRFPPFEFAAVVTTSGTTGLPKCVEHAAAPRLAAGRCYARRLKLTSDDVVAAFLPIFTGNADLMVYHGVPQVGAKTVLLDRFTPEAALELMERERLTGAVVVPTLLNRLINFPGLKDYDVSSMRFFVSFGAPLARDLGERIEAHFGAAILQAYGIAEFGAITSQGVDDPLAARLTTLGKPLDGNEVVVLDESGNPVPPGGTGQIFCRGPYAIGGYYGDAAATRRIWKNGYFATGDLGRFDAEGYLHLEGRERDLIIRGGQNIHPKEIEILLTDHPAIREVAVVRMADAEMGERACAFVIPADGKALTLPDIAAYMEARGVARFKIPERLEIIAEMPLNPSGNKIDKKALEATLASQEE